MAEKTTEGTSPDVAKIIAEDVKTLHGMGYAQELHRRMRGFSNFAISLSIICILAGGITSFHLGLCSVGGPRSAWAGRCRPVLAGRGA